MSDPLEETHPEAAEYIHQAVEEHGEEWVIENYVPQVAQLGVIMEIPAIEELPFYDEENHTAPSEQEKREQAEAYGAYLENLRTGNKPENE